MPLPDSVSRAASSALGMAIETTKSPSAIQELTKMIAQMTSGADTGGVPMTSMQTQFSQPREPIRYISPGAAQVPQGSFETSGERQRAELQAGLNNIASFAKSGAEFLHQRRVRQMETDVTRLMGAFQGLEQAKSTGDKAAAKQNMDIINDMFNDPKKVKAFQKAFDVKLLGDDKGKKTPEHQGLLAAVGKWKQGGGKESGQMNPIAEKFQKSFPVEQGISPQMLARIQAIKAGLLPNAGQVLQAQTEMTKVLAQYEGKALDRDSREKIAKMLVDQKDRGSAAAMARTLSQNRSRKEVAQILASSRKQVAEIQLKGVQERNKVLQSKVKADSSNKALVDLLGKIDLRTKELRKNLEKSSEDDWIFSSQKTKDLQKQVAEAERVQKLITNLAGTKFGVDLSEEGVADQQGAGTNNPDLTDDQINQLAPFFGGGEDEDGGNI
jgi:hypothetical protein